MKKISKNKSHKLILKYCIVFCRYYLQCHWSMILDINDYSHGILIKCIAHINQVKI